MEHRKKIIALIMIATLAFSSFVASASESDNDSITLAYRGLLDRNPTQEDIAYWSQVDTRTMVDGIISSAEFKAHGIHPVSAVYNNILDRQPSDAAWSYWTSMPSFTAVANVLDSDEIHARTSLDFDLLAAPTIDQMIEDAASEFGVSPVVLREIVRCESSFNPNALNASNKEASGLTQQMARYWSARTAAVGDPGADIFDPMANLRVAAWMLANEGTRPWLASRSCHGF